MNFTNPRAEKSRSQSKNNQENQFRISYTATGQELIYGYVPVGIDLAGRKFQVCFYNEDNELVNTTFDIYALRRFIASTHQKLLISMEGCTGSSYWANYAITHGHKAVVLDARAIKNRKAQKDDFNDAFFIREALFTHHQTCRIRTQEEIDLKSFYVQREQYIKSLNAVCSNVRQRLIAAGAYEHVVTGADSALLAIKYYKKQINNKADVGSSSLTLKTLDSFVEDINYLTQKIDRINQDIIDAKARESQVANQLMTIPGIGPQLALLLSLDISDISRFKTARALQAYLVCLLLILAVVVRLKWERCLVTVILWLRECFTRLFLLYYTVVISFKYLHAQNISKECIQEIQLPLNVELSAYVPKS